MLHRHEIMHGNIILWRGGKIPINNYLGGMTGWGWRRGNALCMLRYIEYERNKSQMPSILSSRKFSPFLSSFCSFSFPPTRSLLLILPNVAWKIGLSDYVKWNIVLKLFQKGHYARLNQRLEFISRHALFCGVFHNDWVRRNKKNLIDSRPWAAHFSGISG